MNTFIVINKDGCYGVENRPNGFGGNGSTTLSWVQDINKATVFNALQYKNLRCTQEVIAQIPAVEERRVILHKE